MVAALVMGCAIFMSILKWNGKTLLTVAKVIWVVCSVAVIITTLINVSNPSGVNDIGVFFVYAMLFLSFPVSILIAGFLTCLVIVQDRFGVGVLSLIESRSLGFSLMWFLFFVVGYLQWFVFLPFVWQRLIARRRD